MSNEKLVSAWPYPNYKTFNQFDINLGNNSGISQAWGIPLLFPGFISNSLNVL